MTNILNISQIIITILMVISILLQNRGSGLGSAFGGEGNVYMTKRGAEKSIFIATIILAILFIGLGVLRIIIKQ
ncbi:preprotein translocase subunit SecG [Patescibacteria group bacterium]